MLGGMISTTEDPAMRSRLEQHRDETKAQQERLRGCLEIAAYQLLERVAMRAGDERTAEVARTNRAEEEDMARFIEMHWDDVAMQSLREEGVLA